MDFRKDVLGPPGRACEAFCFLDHAYGINRTEFSGHVGGGLFQGPMHEHWHDTVTNVSPDLSPVNPQQAGEYTSFPENL
ncbi:hypothetical protein Pan181_32380 [Aeoliella mucimassa]|uniref:Uncharacterized protein n=1 Tax=Aeoliella mucimassa TaxID=2527972 RepID=A0A518AQM6_9BACT|nr:hypothetical protein Pan181_32380 [Aeoliella mucimassa]